jgi:Fuc2NAc and GlcNAc transferase
MAAWQPLPAGTWTPQRNCRAGNPARGRFLAVLIIIDFLASALITALLRSYLLRRKILDIPNLRSSHSVPVPRGGGVSIVLVFLLTVLWFVHSGSLAGNVGTALIGGGLAIALTGLLDDHFHLPVFVRLLIHFAAAAWALWQLNGMGPLYLGRIVWDWGWLGRLFAIFGLVWMINLYNFMDGIDGLAGMEVLCVGGLGAFLMARSGLATLSSAAMALAAAGAGFLVWNWPPAKIFMGDAGSGFLGFAFGVLAISSAKEQPSLLWPWLILLSVFIVDSTFTLARRLIAGAHWYEAHRNHAYQHAAVRHGSHLKVTLAVAAIDIVWLFPLAWGASARPAVAPLFVAIAVAPLVYTALRYHAGQTVLVAEASRSGAEVRVALDS